MFDFDNIDLSTACRSCLLETKYMKSMSDRYSTDVSISDMFLYVTSLEFPSDYDGPPTNICLNCFHELSLSYIFVLKCRETNLQLRNHLDKLMKAKETCETLNTKSDLDIKITDSIKTEDINSLNVDIKLEIESELDMFSNDLPLGEIDPLGGIEPEIDPSDIEFKSVNSVSYEPIAELDQKYDLIKNEIDIELKTELEDIKDSNTKESSNQSYITNPVILENLNNNIQTQYQNEQTINCRKEIKKPPDIKNSNHHKQTNDEPYSCAKCNETFSELSCLTLHIKTHKKEKPLAVREKSSNQIEHLSEMTGEKPFHCMLCDKLFNQFGNLKVHMYTHTGEKPYKCTVCGTAFNHLGKLNHHKVLHTGVKPYTCKVCDKSFYRKANLKRHMLGHSK